MGDYPNQNNPKYEGQLQTKQQQPLDPREAVVKQFVKWECEVEALYQRCMPLGIGLGLAAYLGVQRGILKRNKAYGAVPKVIAFSIFGYIAGRFSYQKKCQEKIMKLPNSKFAEMLRQNLCHKNRGSDWSNTYGESGSGIYDSIVPDAGVTTGLSLAPFRSKTEVYSDEHDQPDALNLDTARPSYIGLEESHMPTMKGKNDLNEELNIPTRKNNITYDELRQRNRDEFAKKQYQPYPSTRQPSPAGQPQPSSPELPSEYDRRRSTLRAKTESNDSQFISGPKNKYGDTWSE